MPIYPTNEIIHNLVPPSFSFSFLCLLVCLQGKDLFLQFQVLYSYLRNNPDIFKVPSPLSLTEGGRRG